MENRVSMETVFDNISVDDQNKKAIIDDATEVARIVGELSKARIDRGLTQRDLAKLTGLKQSAIARFETLQAIPRIDTMVRIARALNISISLESISMNKASSKSVYVNRGANCLIMEEPLRV